uniref:Annexin n=1 Tax=Oryzias latipes TaxID=8090 RepID=A0A3P9IQV7_ORYLA
MGSLLDDLESLVEENALSTFTAKGGERGTVKPKAAFDADKDAKALMKAMKGLGTNEKMLTDVLADRSSAQRQLICTAYQKATGRTLLKDLKDETSGDFRNLLVVLVTPPAEYDCHEVMRAIKGVGTERNTLVEIFSSRTNQEIKALSEAFFKETQKQLISKLEKELSGDFSKALLLLAQGNREPGTKADVEKAREDAKTLYSAGEKKLGTDEAKFIDILCRKSIPHIRQILVEYKNISGKTLQQSIEAEMSGSLEKLLVAVVKCAENLPAYFAECLHDSMKGGGTDESTLTRIMVSRSEIDLLDVRTEFKKLYNYSLHSALQSEVSGDYGDCLKAICGGDD